MLGLSPALTGGLVGLAFGIAGYVAMRHAANAIEDRDASGGPVQGRGSAAAQIIRYAALFDLVLLPVLGYIVGPMVLG